MKLSRTLENQILFLENELLKPEVRSSADKIKSLLSEDFFEFTSSGKVYDYKPGDAFIDEPGTGYEIVNFCAHMIADDNVLATYRAKKKKPDGSEEYSLRSSIWKRNGEDWKMVFHQGTQVNR